jgi:TP901 family phage tail tape measure protein
MPLQIPVTQTGLEASIQQAMRNAGRNTQINLGTNSRQINALAQPLGRITGQADEFTKSMEAANARVFAFGASVGIINGVTKAFGSLVKNTIEVEKSLVEINTVLNTSGDSLQKFGNKLFDVAKTTGQTFDVVAKGALELARQGLSTEETLKRINDALILSRLSGLDAQQSVEGLTAAFNSFKETGITTSEILNKLVVVSQKYSVSERDLIEGLKRSASVADQAGVSFDELVGIITTVQERTARGGAVIGNAFKTIFARIQDTGALQDLSNLGIQVTDLEGKVLPATKILQNLGAEFNNLSQLEQADIAKKLGGVYQLSNLLAAVKDLSSEQSKYNDIVKLSAGATNEAYQKNAALNETLASLINKVSVSAQQLGATLGKIGITDSLKGLLSFFNNILEGIQKILGEESALGTFVQGLAKGIGNVLAGPGLALFGAIIAKLSKDLISFGIESLKSFFKIGQSAKEIASVEKAIAAALGSNLTLQRQLFALEGNRAAQLKLMTDAIVQQEAVMRRMSATAGSLAGSLYQQGVRSTGGQGLRVPQAAGGYMPAVSQESRDINRGVGGAKAGDKPVVIPNFAFGGGKKGTMVAHTGEYIVPNFARGGSAIFNRDMVRSMGLPAGAKKIGAAGGFIPNFAVAEDQINAKIAQWRMSDNTGLSALKRVLNAKNPDPINKAAAERLLAEKEKAKTPLNQLIPINQNGREFGMIVGERGVSDTLTRFADNTGKTPTPTQTENSKYRIEVPVYRIQDEKLKFTEIPKLTENISKLATRAALKMAKGLSGNKMPKPENAAYIEKTLNPGALGGTAGTIFEAGIAGILNSNDFKDYEKTPRNSLIDFRGNFSDIRKLYNIPNGLAEIGVEAKGSSGSDLVSSAAEKFLKVTMGEDPFSGQKRKKAATGFIPNFAKYIYDSDRITPDKGATLKAVLASQIKKNLIIGPAGSGKSTLAGKMGKFLSGVGDVANASEIDILSGAARAKGGGISKNLEAIISAVNNSGGKVSYLYAKNLDILSRRAGRTVAEEGDLRSKKQLKGTTYAPLNQFDFMGYVKSKSRNFNLVNGAKGFIPNFADPLKEAIDREMSAGVPASQIYVDQNSSLKNSMNPMGLMVANRRDEPAGGMQGINRARKEGANPMLYGASGGYVPNYAAKNTPGSSSGTDDLEGPKRDFLGTIFAVQTGLTLFNGATADATSGIGKFSNIILDGASTFTTALLAVQGLGSIGGKTGQLLSKLGPAATVAAAGFAIIKGGLEIYRNFITDDAKNASLSLAQFSDTVNKAGVSLSSLSQEEQIKRKQGAKDIIYNLSGGRVGGVGSKELQSTIAEFQLLSGIKDEDKIKDILQKGGAYGDRKLFQSSSIDEDLAGQALSKFLKTEEAQKNIAKLKAEQLQKQQQENKLSQEINLKEQINIDLVKSRFKSELDIAIARQRSLDNLDKQKISSEILNNLSEKELDNLNYQIERREIIRQSIDNVKSLIDEQINKLDGVVGKEKESEEIRRKISQLTEADLQNQDKVLSIVGELQTIISDNTDLRSAEKQKLEEILKDLANKKQLELDSLKTNKDTTDQVKQQRDAVLSLISASSRGVITLSSQAALGNTSKINTNQLQINRLQSQLSQPGITDAQSRALENQIAALETNTTLLNNDNDRLRNLQQAREQAVSALPDELKTNAKIVDQINKTSNYGDLSVILRSQAKYTDAMGNAATEIENSGLAAEQSAANNLALAEQTEDLRKIYSNVITAAQKAALAFEQIPQQIEDLDFEAMTTTSGRRLAEIAYQKETLRRMQDAGAEGSAAVEKQRSVKGIGQLYKEEFSTTVEERAMNLNKSIVDASVQFRDNLIDGVSKAIEEGGGLGDVLRSAALDFARSMTQAGLKNVTSQIGGLFGFAKGGLVPNMASGGMINGGSGSKDDIPAMLMGGEYVLKKTAVQKYGSDFLDALNNGRLGGYAKGGEVDKLPNQTGAGGFFVPGLNGYGSIVGKENLLGFATQSYTSGAGDIVRSGDNFASVNLETESLRLSRFGRTNDRMFQATQSAKEEAFGLYGQQLQQEQDYKKQLEEYEKQKKAQRKAEKKALRNQLIMMAVSAFAGPVLGAAGAGFKAAFGAAGGMQNFLPAAGAGLKGIFTGGSVGGVNVGGLGNLFKGVGQGLTGNFSGAGNSFKLSQISNMDQLSQSYAKGNPNFTGFLDKAGFEYAPRASVINESIGTNGGLGGGGAFGWLQNIGKMFGGGSGGENDFITTGEDIKDPSLWMRGGPSTAYDEGLLPPLNWKEDSSGINFNSIPLEQDTGKRAVLNAGNGKRYAVGGQIPNTAGVDTVPAMLSGGEFIMNRAASQNIGAGNLQSLNAGASSLPTEEKTEELNDKLIAKLDELIEATSGGGDITINVEASTGKTSEEGASSENEKKVQMARLIKDMVVKIIQDEKRLGGVLRRG